MLKISAVIITFNEEKNIERCLRSIQEVADEIVVVDSSSTDRTREICERYPVRFIENVFEGHIEQKNFALAQCAFQHVLSLDADEALSDKLKLFILKKKENWDKDGYTMNRLTNYCGKWIKHGGWYPDKKLRLFDKRKAHWGGTNPHDKVVMSTGSSIGHIHGDLLHYTIYNIQQHINQVNYFTDISSNMAFSKGKRGSLFNIIFNPLFKFCKSYFIQLGFLDGLYGFVIAIISAHAKFLKYVKLKELEMNQNKEA